jgi:hypothetical protein
MVLGERGADLLASASVDALRVRVGERNQRDLRLARRPALVRGPPRCARRGERLTSHRLRVTIDGCRPRARVVCLGLAMWGRR